MKIEEFGIEIWLNEYEQQCNINLAQTCVSALDIKDLLNISGKGEDYLEELISTRLSYGEIEGYIPLRKEITKLYKNMKVGNILTTHGCVGANALVFSALIESGDTVIATMPTYQQHYSFPRSLGAEVKFLDLTPRNSYLPDLEQLRSYIKDNTKLICISNPNNPTGSLMDEEFLLKIVDIARECGAYILCDEVYRGLNHQGNAFTTSIGDLYEKGISTSSMSKAFSMPGLRMGWIAAQREVIEKVSAYRNYTTFSASVIDEKIATIALENIEYIVNRNIKTIRENMKILENWVEKEPKVSYIKPKCSTTSFIKLHIEMSSEKFCLGLLEKTGVLLVPGSAFEKEGFVRLCFACEGEILKRGLEKISKYLKEV